MSYAVVKLGSPIEVIATYQEVPSNLVWPNGDATCGASVGLSHITYVPVTEPTPEGEEPPPPVVDAVYRLLEVLEVDSPPPTSLHIRAGETYAVSINNLVVTPAYSEPPLNEMILTARARINAWKKRMQDGGFFFNDVKFDSTPESRAAINGAVTMALVATNAQQPYQVTWTSADNSQVTMDGPTMVLFSVAAGQSFTSWHQLATQAKDDIANLPTPITAAAIQAILDDLEGV